MKTCTKILTAVLAVAAACAAQTLGPAFNPSYNVRISNGSSTTMHTPGTLSDGFESATLIASSPSVEAFSSSVDGHGNSTGAASIFYYFEIVGPAGPVPVDISAHFLLDFENPVEPGDYDSNLNYTLLRVSDGNACCASESSSQGDPNLPYGTVGGFGEYTTTFHSTAQANSIISVDLEAEASGIGHGSAHALVNQFTIGFGAGFDSSVYTLELSSGVGNGQSAAPEPGTVLLFLTALAGTVALRVSKNLRGARHGVVAETGTVVS